MPARLSFPARRLLLAAAIGAALPLAACGGGQPADPLAGAAQDPAIGNALAGPLMVDPQLAGEQGAALSANSGAIDIPLDLRTPEAIAAAREDAARLAGGAVIALPPPPAGASGTGSPIALTAAQVALQSGAANGPCAARLGYSAIWAARLPADMPVYPRGAVQEAAGADGPGCTLRVVHFLTPVATGDVMAFYKLMAQRAGLGVDYRGEGADAVMGGRKPGRTWLVRAHARDDGMTEVDLVAGGA